MGDAGCIGSIIEDTLEALIMMYERNELSKEKLKFAWILLKSINKDCEEQSIDLDIMDYLNYMEELVS